jgi:hypothetical protein
MPPAPARSHMRRRRRCRARRWRLGHGGVAGLPQGGDVVDIDAELAWGGLVFSGGKPVKIMAMPRSSAAAMTSLSLDGAAGLDGGGGAGSAAAMRPSGKGKKASLATALPGEGLRPAEAFQMAMREESMRDICPAPMPRVRSLRGVDDGVGLDVLDHAPAEEQAFISSAVGGRSGDDFLQSFSSRKRCRRRVAVLDQEAAESPSGADFESSGRGRGVSELAHEAQVLLFLRRRARRARSPGR